MTAIVAVLTEDGFIIGADGRRRETVIDAITTESAQKIFSFQHGHITLAHAWTGTTENVTQDNVCLFDLPAASQEILSLVALQAKDDLFFFMQSFCAILHQKFPQAEIDRAIADFEVARGLFLGYYDGVPFTVYVRVAYLNSHLDVSGGSINLSAGVNKVVFSGAKSIYSEKYDHWNPDSATDAITFVRQYIQECVDSPNSDCAGIGGHIHVARITHGGFSWVDPPHAG